MRALRSFLGPALFAASCSLPDFTFLEQPLSSCADGLANGAETDEDCGGDRCGPCTVGRTCDQNRDCKQDSCVARRCQAQHCVDQARGDDETDVDCGGPSCARCGVNQRCNLPSDCASNACSEGRCIATGCDDGVTNRAETDMDCGGGTCPPCAIAKRCSSSGDCGSGICLNERCSTESCADGVKSPGETGKDCGGECPARCPPGEECVANGDCLDGTCTGGRCVGPCSSGALEGSSGAPLRSCEPAGSSGAGGQAAAPGSGGSAGNEASGGTTTAAGAGGTSNASGAPGAKAGAGGMVAGGAGSAGAPAAGASAGGTAGTSGTSGTSGASGTGGTTGGVRCPGCAVLSVPLSEPGDRGNFLITLPSPTDFSRATIRYRIFKRAGTTGDIKGYVQHGGDPDFAQLFQFPYPSLSTISGWFELVWDVGGQAANYDKTIVQRVGIQIIGLGESSETQPTVVYVDSISVEGPRVGPWLFEDASSVSPEANVGAPPNVLWRNAGDNPVAGAAVSWFTE